jgi:hypothetical protein
MTVQSEENEYMPSAGRDVVCRIRWKAEAFLVIAISPQLQV